MRVVVVDVVGVSADDDVARVVVVGVRVADVADDAAVGRCRWWC